MKVQGRCHCGDIRYEAQVDPATAGVCHCDDCKALTGSAFRVNVRALAADFHLTGGPPTIYIKTADSGARRAHAFCPKCGAPVYATSPEAPTAYSLRIGALDRRDELPPQRQIWCQSALPWSELKGIEALDRQ